MEGKLIAYSSIEGGKFKLWEGKEVLVKTYLQTPFKTVENKDFSYVLKETVQSAAFMVHGTPIVTALFSNGSLVRLKNMKGECYVDLDKNFVDKMMENIVSKIN